MSAVNNITRAPLIPSPNNGERIDLNIIEQTRAGRTSYSVYWSMAEDDWWLDGGFISTHRSREAAETKMASVDRWLKAGRP